MSDLDNWVNEVHHGDCIKTMGSMPKNSIDAVVTDPPYGISFMSQTWDDYEPEKYQEWCGDWASEALKALKPGGHLLAFSGERTFHRLMCAIEDAGFEIRTTLLWLHGEGFPKGHNISKAIDKKLGKEDEREVVKEYQESSGYKSIQKESEKQGHRPDTYYDDEPDTIKRTEPATEEAKRWHGFNTALKPAYEPIVLARAPITEETLVENVMEWGTGALNIDGCRIPTSEDITKENDGGYGDSSRDFGGNSSDFEGEEHTPEGVHKGRWPANVVTDEEAADVVDEEAGDGRSSASKKRHGGYEGNSIFLNGESHPGNQYDDEGGPSRFFYTSKARKDERTVQGRIENDHPTVKPVDLMRWLVKMVTNDGQVVLDPFMGSGTTAIAAERDRRDWIGIDGSQEYVELARKRIEADKKVHGRPSSLLEVDEDE